MLETGAPRTPALVATLVALLSSLGIACDKKPVAGGDCPGFNVSVCADARTKLVCVDQRWLPNPCLGPAGCGAGATHATCDRGSNDSDGKPCALEYDDPKSWCAPDGKAALSCEKNVVVSRRCSGAQGCYYAADKSLSCDDAIQAGDACAQPSNYECDHGAIFRCVDAKWALVERCAHGCQKEGAKDMFGKARLPTIDKAADGTTTWTSHSVVSCKE